MSNGKAMIILLTVGLITKTYYEGVDVFQNQNLFKEK